MKVDKTEIQAERKKQRVLDNLKYDFHQARVAMELEMDRSHIGNKEHSDNLLMWVLNHAG